MPDEEEEVLAELLTEDEIRRRNAANRRKRGMTLKRAVGLLEREYERATGLDWIHNPLAYARETPWSKPFYEKFCKDCPAPEYTLDDGRKLCLHECDFKDGKCPHGTDIVWWLQQPAEEVDHEV